MNYLRDPDAIYAQSFATIRDEAELAHLPPELHDVAIRMIHACGMPDLAADIVGDPRVVEAVASAIRLGCNVLCDSKMVRAGIIRRYVRGCKLVVTVDDPDVLYLAQKIYTTRSAAAVRLWEDRIAGAVIVIGNAPTALFEFLDCLVERKEWADLQPPAAIIATPVGFVGAAESKARLIAESPVPFITVSGRRGGSAIACAAFNAMAIEAAVDVL